MPRQGARPPPGDPEPPIYPTRSMPRMDRMATEPELRHRSPSPDPVPPRVQAAAPAAPAPLAKTSRQHAVPHHQTTFRPVPMQVPVPAAAARRAKPAPPPAPASTSRAPPRPAPPTTRAPVSSSARATRPSTTEAAPRARVPTSSNPAPIESKKTPPRRTPPEQTTRMKRQPAGAALPAAYASPAPPRISARDSPAMRSACSSRVGSDASISSSGSFGLCGVAYVTPIRAMRETTQDEPNITCSQPELPQLGLGQPPQDTLGFGYEFNLEPRAQRRPRSPEEDAAEEAKRPCIAASQPQRDPRRLRTTPTPSYSDVTTCPPPTAAAPVQPTAVPSGSTTAAEQQKKTKKPRYPPLIVEKLPNWAQHFRAIRDKLGRPPCARPYQQGIRFVPETEDEFRLVQRYLTDLEKRENISWFSYSLPAEKSLKVAITGLPADTDPQEIEEELRALGFEPEYVRHIKARHGRPGCVFHAMLRRTPDFREIFDITVLLCMRGVKVEAWRGKRGPAQCHRCQLFRHSSHLCHRPLACVRCGGEHTSRDCPRPLEEPPTCANCAGPHTANNFRCPVYQREARNKRAGTVAKSTEHRPRAQVDTRPQPCADETQSATLMAAANEPKARGENTEPKERRKRKRGGKKRKARPAASEAEEQGAQAQCDLAPPPPPETSEISTAAATVKGGAVKTNVNPPPKLNPIATTSAPQTSKQVLPNKKEALQSRQQQHKSGAAPAGHGVPTTPEEYKKYILGAVIRVLQDVLHALMAGQDPVPVILGGIATLFTTG